MNNKEDQIDLYLVTGFLGSGKTTLLQNLLTSFPESKVGVIINEFGELGIDGKVVNKEGLELVEIENGSIFCCCRKVPFIDGLSTLAKEDIDILLVETSGLSDPSNMQKILKQAEEVTGPAFNYQGSICIVNAANFLKVITTNQAVEKQVLYSDLIVINKLDLGEKKEIAEIEKKIRQFNPGAQIIKTTYCQIDLTVLENLVKVKSSGGKESINTPDNRPQTYVCKIQKVVERRKIVKFLESLSNYLFRFKGFVQLIDGWYYVNGVKDNIEFVSIESKRETSKLVLIAGSEEAGDIKEIIKVKGEKSFPGELIIN